ncbi:MAG: hypothetical protein K9M99_11770 [Candidatus Cloacimonetes bacterium]|nr:hypothetical protein [Candidatus Cloacimonadota bacterium]
MKMIMVIILFCALVTACICEDITTKDGLEIKYWLSDSEGVESDVFAANEVIQGHFTVTNTSEEDIHCYTCAEVMCAYTISPKAAEDPEVEEQFLPPLVISGDLIQKPGEILEDTYYFTEAAAGEYMLKIQPFLVYDRVEINKDSRIEIEFRVVVE